jgi:pimeloyl-ACP methyl ester carboxylesterase
MTIAEWWAEGDVEPLALNGTERGIFCHRLGSGPSMTLLHGYPSSSYDWAEAAASLSSSHALLMPDLLGFGASDKPTGHTYSIHEQADLVEALWARDGVRETTLVTHDYADTVAQELLARRGEGRLSVDINALCLLNGGIYPDLHRPEPIQIALLDPAQGPQISASITAELTAQALRPTFAPDFDFASTANDIWIASSRDHVNLHELISYIPDRQEHERRWVDALESTDVPLTFVWGMLDPISGAHMIERVHERIPRATVVELADVGHWPAIEAPEAVVEAIARRRA